MDALLKDQELMSTIDRMCRKSNADLPLYIQFLMEKAGDHSLHDFARIIVEYGQRWCLSPTWSNEGQLYYTLYIRQQYNVSENYIFHALSVTGVKKGI